MPATDPRSERRFTLSDFDFTLPPGLIAQHPTPRRSDSRLLDGSAEQPIDRVFRDLSALLRRGDLLVFNDTRVMKARLFGQKPSGGKLELLIERVLGGNLVAAHMRVSKKPKVGTTLALTGAPGTQDGLSATLLGRWPDAQGALFRLALSNDVGDDPLTLLERHGHVPLPPYITHADSAQDAARYQTVFAKYPGAVAAPTAALHFDQALLARMDAQGVQCAFVTLHVGAGTFQPVKTENLAEHQMHSEWYQVPVATQQAVLDCRARGGRIVAVGTTSVRALESWANEIAKESGASRLDSHCGPDPQSMPANHGCRIGVGSELRESRSGNVDSTLTPIAQVPFSADTRIFITPGFDFKLVDMLITNFHLPKSSLMMLVSAFAGYERIRALYRHAIDQRYRFFSYGDAMLLQRIDGEVR